MCIRDSTGSLQEGIKGLIDGTKSLNDVFADMLSKLADIALNIAFGQMNGGLTNLFKNIGARADGGPIEPGRPYLVGEEGPELIIPGAGGTVVPNDAFKTAAASVSSGVPSTDGDDQSYICLLYTSPSPRDRTRYRMPSSA